MKTPLKTLAILRIHNFDDEWREDYNQDDAYQVAIEINGQSELMDQEFVEIFEDEETKELSCKPIENILKDLKEQFDYTTEELSAIKESIIENLFTYKYDE